MFFQNFFFPVCAFHFHQITTQKTNQNLYQISTMQQKNKTKKTELNFIVVLLGGFEPKAADICCYGSY